MKFSVIYELQKQRPWESEDNREVYAEALEQIMFADRLGYHTAWVVEHHFLPEFSHSPRPDIFLGHLAAKTERIRLGHGVVVLPINHPVRVAEGIAVLDILSNGRIEFGTGRGLSPLEMRSFGVEPEDTRAMWEESVKMMKDIWKSEIFEHKGKYWTVPPRPVIPKPVQKPHPPLWMAGTQPASFEYAAHHGVGIIALNAGPPARLSRAFEKYRKAAETAEPVGDFPNFKCSTLAMCHLGDDIEDAKTRGAEAAKWYLGVNRRYARDFSTGSDSWGDMADEEIPESYRWYAETAKRGGDLKTGLGTLTADDMVENTVVVAGGVDEAIRAMKAYEEIGTDEVLLLMQMGNIPHERIMRSLEIFATQVMPHFDQS